VFPQVAVTIRTMIHLAANGCPRVPRPRTGAEFLCRSGARQIPLIIQRLPDGSYLSAFGMGKLPVRIVEAWITMTGPALARSSAGTDA
jgi:hypothetical protein